MRRVMQMAVEVVKSSASLYVELATSALQLLPRRRQPSAPLGRRVPAV
jgi:hypothetical protein